VSGAPGGWRLARGEAASSPRALVHLHVLLNGNGNYGMFKGFFFGITIQKVKSSTFESCGFRRDLEGFEREARRGQKFDLKRAGYK